MKVHGHEVIEMMQESGKLYSRDILISEIVEKFGLDTRFYTCSADDLTPEHLIDFLESKGKFLHSEGGFRFDTPRGCNHG